MHTFADSTSSHNNLLIWSVVSAMYKLLIFFVLFLQGINGKKTIIHFNSYNFFFLLLCEYTCNETK